MKRNPWIVFVCPECGRAETRPWSQCWCPCTSGGDEQWSVQVYDPDKERRDRHWTSMCRVPRERMKRLVTGVLAA